MFQRVPRYEGGSVKRTSETDIKLFQVPAGTGMSPFGIYGAGSADEPKQTVANPMLQRAFFAADRADEYVNKGWHRTPEDAWAAWRGIIEQKIPDAEERVKHLRQELKYLRRYLANGTAR